MRIHRVRHTDRPGEQVRPWVYAIARWVRVDGYPVGQRIETHEITMAVLPERVQHRDALPAGAHRRTQYINKCRLSSHASLHQIVRRIIADFQPVAVDLRHLWEQLGSASPGKGSRPTITCLGCDPCSYLQRRSSRGLRT
jgi:hypothetical protein